MRRGFRLTGGASTTPKEGRAARLLTRWVVTVVAVPRLAQAPDHTAHGVDGDHHRRQDQHNERQQPNDGRPRQHRALGLTPGDRTDDMIDAASGRRRRAAARYLQRASGLANGSACHVAGQHRATQHHEATPQYELERLGSVTEPRQATARNIVRLRDYTQ